MKIIALQTGSTAPFTLCDHGREGPNAWLPVPVRQVDVLPFVQSAFSKPRNRGNTLLQVSFAVSREHADMTTAQKYLMDIDSAVPKQGPVRIDFEDQVSTRLIPDATTEATPLKCTGVLSTVSYVIKYGCEPVEGILCDTADFDNGGSGNILFSSDAAFSAALYGADKAVFLSEDSTPFNDEQDLIEGSGTDSAIYVPNGTFVAADVENRTFGIYPVI
jgi:hypothetical protein